MKIDKPRVSIKPQSQTTTPVTGDDTLVDDPVALVDSTTALSGGQATIYTGLKFNVKYTVPRTSIKLRR